MSESKDLTHPDDYREILTAASKPVIVGGQAVNLWAAMYLPLDGKTTYGSVDLDVLSTKTVLHELSTLRGWNFKRTPLHAFGDIRHAMMDKKTSDGRHLHVEILHSVLGLDAADLASPVEISFADASYNLLDPVVMLKAKATNIMRLKQDGPEPRNDRRHFHLLAKVVPEYLRDIHEQARIGGLPIALVEKTLRTLFKTMQDKKLARVFNTENVGPKTLVPAEFAKSFSEAIRSALEHQIPKSQKRIAGAKQIHAKTPKL